ncbi:MAG: hypothetical protein ONB13_02900, partial [candidate division KSB1 bacterium]|nr:hypothetical protein [candidate division KSB1 bacterium]
MCSPDLISPNKKALVPIRGLAPGLWSLNETIQLCWRTRYIIKIFIPITFFPLVRIGGLHIFGPGLRIPIDRICPICQGSLGNQ